MSNLTQSGAVKVTEADVKDPEAYKEYLRLKDHPILNALSKVKDSTGKTINLGNLKNVLLKQIEHLPEEEQQAILKKKAVHYKIMCSRNGFKRKAFGTHVNGENIVTQIHADKVFGDRKYELIELFGRMFSVTEVHQMCLESFKITCTRKQLEEFRKQYDPEISTRIEEYQRSYSDIRLGHKRSRLEELSWMYVKRKRIYEITKKGEDHRLLLSTLEQLRKEAEGDKLRIDGSLDLSIDSAIQSHLNEQLQKKMVLMELIMARVAVRAKVPVERLLQQMGTSYYNTFMGNPEEVRVQEFPSAQTYDFERIARIQNQHEAERQNEMEIDKKTVITSAPVAEKARSIKEIMMAKLNAKNGDINAIKNSTLGKEIERHGDANNI